MKTKAQIAVWVTIAVTFAVAMSQPTIAHQIAVFASGIFAMMGIGLVFAVRNWPETATDVKQALQENSEEKTPELTERLIIAVHHLRGMGMTDEYIASGTGLTVEQIKAIK